MDLRRLPAAGLVLISLSSCSGKSSGQADQPDTGGEQDISDVIYVGTVTDEALVRLLDVTPKDDPANAMIIDSPDLSLPLAQGTAATFEFHPASQALDESGVRRAPALAVGQPSNWLRAYHALGHFFSLEGTAHAHGTPYNGTAYYLVISDANAKTRLQVFTTGTAYTPEAVDWQNLAQAPQPLKLEITWAVFDENAIRADGGPFVGGTFPFTIR